MEGSSQSSQPSDDGRVVRAERFEVVDERGRVRAVIGSIEEEADGEEVVGVELRDPDGSPRGTFGLSSDGPWLIFELGGNLLVHLGVNDPGRDVVDAGAFLYLSDHLGRPVIGWRVTDRGILYATDPRGSADPGDSRDRGDSDG